MKRLFALLLIGSMSFTMIAACDQDGETAETATTTQNQTSRADSVEATTTDRDDESEGSEDVDISSPDAGATDVDLGKEDLDDDDYVYDPDEANPWSLYEDSPLVSLAMLFQNEKHPDGRLESTIPSFMVSEVIEEALEENKDAFGKYETMRRNSDGSITIIYSKAEHERMLKNIRDGLHLLFEQTKEAIPSYRSLEYDKDMTDVKILVDAGQWRDYDGMGAIGMTMFIMMYNAYSGTSEEMGDFTLNFVDDKTGEIITSGLD